MNAHRSLGRQDVLRYPPHKISLMIATEFLRAESRADYPQIVAGCFRRARELMGILETISIESEVAVLLQPCYRECVQARLFPSEPLTPSQVRTIAASLAEQFEAASSRLSGGIDHA